MFQRQRNLQIAGMPENVPENIAAPQRSRFFEAAHRLMDSSKEPALRITIWDAAQINLAEPPADTTAPVGDELTREQRAQQYQPQPPIYRFDQLILPEAVLDELLLAIEVINVQPQVFGAWGLSQIEPFPRTSLNFYGPPGTGKTLAAHAIAQHLGRPILAASYADIESKFHGDGPKNVEAIFHAASRDGAVLFIDEADSLLSRRLTNVSQGSEQAINSMRSQLLLSLDRFQGVVIFATNLVENYDQAFETRVRHIRFPLPDERGRREIWRCHLPLQLPLGPDVEIAQLAAHADEVCGRDIKNAVIDAAVRVARDGRPWVTLADLTRAIDQIKSARIIVPAAEALSPQELAVISQQIQTTIAESA